jgi:fibronectin type 3 domain-containing protein
MKALFIILILCYGPLHSQSHLYLKTDSAGNVYLKWYIPDLVNENGFHIYRKATGMQWERLTSTPILYGKKLPTISAYNADPLLHSYIQLASALKQGKAMIRTAVILRSFTSAPLCRYLGITYTDSSAKRGQYYEYRLSAVNKNSEEQLAADTINAGVPQTNRAPQNIISKISGRKVSFRWSPEPMRYYGVNIYRQENDSLVLLTKDPLVLSRTRSANGKEDYPEFFFVQGRLQQKQTYVYRFQAVDFFGEGSALSEPVSIYIKDTEAPGRPDSVRIRPAGKAVRVSWVKQDKEPDLLGYNIYRTTKNDTDYTKLNTSIIPGNVMSYTDTVITFGSYLYKVGIMDNDGNESVTNPYLTEVYDNDPPGLPANIAITADTGRILLSWTPGKEDDLKGYLVFRSLDPSSAESFVKLTPTALGVNTFTDLLPANARNRFYYFLVSVDSTGNKSTHSMIVSARMPDVVPPSAPFLKTILEKNTHAQLEWFLNPEADLKSYSVYRKNVSDTSGDFFCINKLPIDRRTNIFTDYSLNRDVTCQYYITATDSSGNISIPSNSITFRLKKEDQLLIEFEKVQAKFHRKSGKVEMRWHISETETLAGFVVFRKSEDETLFRPVSGTISDLHFSDSDIRCPAHYEYQVRAYNKVGDASRSVVLSVNTKP